MSETWYYANNVGYITPVVVTMATKHSVTLANEGTYPRRTDSRLYTNSLPEAVEYARASLETAIAESHQKTEVLRGHLRELEAKYGAE